MALTAFMRYQELVRGIPAPTNHDRILEFCNKLNIGYEVIFAKSRKLKNVRYKAIFCNWLRLSHVEVAEVLGLHHSTVIHHRKTHKDRLGYDREYKRLYSILTHNL